MQAEDPRLAADVQSRLPIDDKPRLSPIDINQITH